MKNVKFQRGDGSEQTYAEILAVKENKKTHNTT